MKLKYGNGRNRLFEVDISKDYFLDNGACIQLITKDPDKRIFRDWHDYGNFRFSKTRFLKLLKDGFIERKKEDGFLTYYTFTEKALAWPGEFT